MDFDHISQYILPILILLFYVFAGGRKKKPQEPQRDAYPDDFEDEEELGEEEEAYTAPPLLQRQQSLLKPPQKTPSSLPPVQRTLSDFESAISSRYVANNIEDRSYVSAISDERAESLISSGLSERIDLDQAYAIKPRHRNSRGGALLTKSSLKEAFILQEIFKRPDVF